MLNILGMIILIIILFIIILLAFGIRISLEYEKKASSIKGCLKILIFKKIKVYSQKIPSEDEDDEEEDEDKERKKIDIKKLYRLAKPCFEDFKDYFKSCLSSVNIAKCENHLIFGLDSFADTGKYIGFIWSALAAINSMHNKLELSAEPSFSGSVIDGYGKNDIEIHILKLIIPTARLVSKKHVRKFIRGVLDERKNRQDNVGNNEDG